VSSRSQLVLILRRIQLERIGALEPRMSVLDEEYEEIEQQREKEEAEKAKAEMEEKLEKERKKEIAKNKERVRIRRHLSKSAFYSIPITTPLALQEPRSASRSIQIPREEKREVL